VVEGFVEGGFEAVGWDGLLEVAEGEGKVLFGKDGSFSLSWSCF